MTKNNEHCAKCTLDQSSMPCGIIRELGQILLETKDKPSPYANGHLGELHACNTLETELKSKRPLNKSLIQAQLMKRANVSYEQAKDVLDSLVDLIKHEISPSGSGKFTIPGVFTCQVQARSVNGKSDGEKNPSLRVTIDKDLRSKVARNNLDDYSHVLALAAEVK